MRALYGRTYEAPAITVMNYNVPAAVGNVFTLYCAGNRRQGYESDMSIAVIEKLIRLTRQPIKEWDVLATGGKKDVLVLDMRAKLKEIETSVLAEILRPMMDPPEFIRDIGSHLVDSLTGEDGLGWFREYVASPSTGPARPYVMPNSNTGGVDTFGPYVPDLCSGWSASLASACILADRPRWTMDLIPGNDEAAGGGHGAKDQPWGTFKTFARQIETLHAIGVLYNIGPALLWVHCNARRWSVLLDIIEAREPKSTPVIDSARAALDFLIRLPIHPLLSAVANAASGVSCKTVFGEKPLLLRAVDPTSLHTYTDDTSGSDEPLVFLSALVTETISKADLLRDSWGWCETPASGGQKKQLTFLQLARQIKSIPLLMERFDAVRTKLGWADVRSSPFTLDHGAADFVATDGIGYSDVFERVLLGFTPALSLGNVKSAGHLRRHEDDFNSKPDTNTEQKISYSIITVDGYQAPLGDDLALLRAYIPAGMSMGEDDTTFIPAVNLRGDTLVATLIAALERQSAAYVEPFYATPTGTDPAFVRTDWDGFSTGVLAREATASLAVGYVTQTKPVLDSLFLSRSRFYHRVPVRLARPYAITLFDTQFRVRAVTEFDGHIEFDDTLSLSHTTTYGENIVNTASLGERPATKGLAGIEGNQIVVKE